MRVSRPSLGAGLTPLGPSPQIPSTPVAAPTRSWGWATSTKAWWHAQPRETYRTDCRRSPAAFPRRWDRVQHPRATDWSLPRAPMYPSRYLARQYWPHDAPPDRFLRPTLCHHSKWTPDVISFYINFKTTGRREMHLQHGLIWPERSQGVGIWHSTLFFFFHIFRGKLKCLLKFYSHDITRFKKKKKKEFHRNDVHL